MTIRSSTILKTGFAHPSCRYDICLASGKTVRDYPSSAQALTFPFRSFFLNDRILYAKVLYPYQFSVTADRSSEVKTMAPSIALCYCLQLNLPPFPSPTRADVLRLGISQAGCVYDDVRMLITVQLMEVELTPERLESYPLPAGPLRAVNASITLPRLSYDLIRPTCPFCFAQFWDIVPPLPLPEL
ncbi:hypothetical protein K443DRAFT_10469 [Laccaria amethystina LaAM-08-1]|uniref:Uncharacterized protein n=1 Tax=Laccaria amethystina LaAM-08-1 TaxID=1095629 RepID=A0A0C9X5S9_9AGAR|nr:hypothetical protein K443DRAFT_10469 [Laccaria amethystina LaAM-08-1]